MRDNVCKLKQERFKLKQEKLGLEARKIFSPMWTGQQCNSDKARFYHLCPWRFSGPDWIKP